MSTGGNVCGTYAGSCTTALSRSSRCWALRAKDGRVSSWLTSERGFPGGAQSARLRTTQQRINYIRTQPSAFQHDIASAVRRTKWSELDVARCHKWQRQLRAVADADDPPEPELPASIYRCYSGRSFINVGAYRTHHTRDHHPGDLAQRFAPASLRHACGKGFDARPRLIHHLRYRCTPC